jgi:putative flippase GtrA
LTSNIKAGDEPQRSGVAGRQQTPGASLTPTFSNVARLGRFGMVGVVATFIYFAITTILGRPPIGMDPLAANTLGVAASLSVSYFGHHRYTFRMLGEHERYLPRFLIVMAGLFLLSTVAMAIARYVWVLDHSLVTASIAVCCPFVSYLLNLLWTFSHNGIQEPHPDKNSTQ